MIIRARVKPLSACGVFLLLLTGIYACSPSRDAVRDGRAEKDSVGVVSADSSREGGATSPPASDSVDVRERQATIQVARVAPEVEEGGVAFDLLGATSAVQRGGIFYADGRALLALMMERGSLVLQAGRVTIDGVATDIRGYNRGGIPFVPVEPLARHFRALVMKSPHRPGSVTIWPRATLAFLKQAGDTAGGPYQQAKREGLIP